MYTALLDTEIDAPRGELFPFVSKEDYRYPFFSTPIYPLCTWTFVRCLPLVFESTYTSGLTMFWRRGILRGIASYGPGNKTASVGLCTGEATHFTLSPGEYFSTFWIRMGWVSPTVPGPFILTLGTSFGRSAHFGPQILMRPWRSSPMLYHVWEPISAWVGPTKITYLLVEGLGEWHTGGHRSFGVVQAPLTSSNDEKALVVPTVPEMEVLSPDPQEHFDFHKAFLSTGSLRDVESIEVRRKGIRCVGMRVVHGAGLDDCLGSWDPTDTSSISIVYESSRHGPLVRLLFNVRFTTEDRKPIIVNVIANDSSNSHIASENTKTLKVRDYSLAMHPSCSWYVAAIQV